MGELTLFPEDPYMRRLRELHGQYPTTRLLPLYDGRRIRAEALALDLSESWVDRDLAALCDLRDRNATARDLAEWAAAEAARVQREQDEALRWAGSVATFAELERRDAGSADGDRLFIRSHDRAVEAVTGRHVRLGPDGQPERPTSGPDSLVDQAGPEPDGVTLLWDPEPGDCAPWRSRHPRGGWCWSLFALEPGAWQTSGRPWERTPCADPWPRVFVVACTVDDDGTRGPGRHHPARITITPADIADGPVVTGRCICGTPGIDYDGPDIECPQHGDPDRVTCPYCDGRGEARWPGELWVCSACGGNGWHNGTATLGQYLGGGVFAPPEPCDTCDGTGRAPDLAEDVITPGPDTTRWTP